MLTPTVRRTWAPRGTTPLLVHRYSHDKISAISAVTVRPRRQRLGLYCHFHFTSVSGHQCKMYKRASRLNSVACERGVLAATENRAVGPSHRSIRVPKRLSAVPDHGKYFS